MKKYLSRLKNFDLRAIATGGRLPLVWNPSQGQQVGLVADAVDHLARVLMDALIQSYARRLQDRKLFKCVDIGTKVAHEQDPENKGDKGNIGNMHRCCTRILSGLADLKEETRTSDGVPMILTDVASRSPYREDNDEFESMERIWVRSDGGALMDLLHRSQVIGALREFALSWAYFDRDRDDVGRKIQNIIDREVKACR